MWQHYNGLAAGFVCRKPEPANDVVLLARRRDRRLKCEPLVAQRKLRRGLVTKELLAPLDSSPVQAKNKILFAFRLFHALFGERPRPAPLDSILERTRYS